MVIINYSNYDNKLLMIFIGKISIEEKNFCSQERVILSAGKYFCFTNYQPRLFEKKNHKNITSIEKLRMFRRQKVIKKADFGGMTHIHIFHEYTNLYKNM